jgi:hypothetical protein
MLRRAAPRFAMRIGRVIAHKALAGDAKITHFIGNVQNLNLISFGEELTGASNENLQKIPHILHLNHSLQQLQPNQCCAFTCMKSLSSTKSLKEDPKSLSIKMTHIILKYFKRNELSPKF